ncbi:MAG TPA: NAD(P)-dependent oxidoreductase [Candidatus Eisenbacteria bacterium]|nr:NAD(P)-dependent oxidoreductase [Candidatus Eisenbacteria bacterium]
MSAEGPAGAATDQRPPERFLVTGALGCIGAWTVRELVREGVPVVAFDVGRDTRRLALVMTPEELAQVTFVVGDITDLDGLYRALEDHYITNVVHLAALQVPFCRSDPPLGARVNVTGTVNVFEAVRRRADGMAPVVYTGSIGMFSASDADPVTNRLREDAEPHPGNHYGVYKHANEGTARIYLADAGVPSVGLRPMTVYGAGRDQGMTSGPTVAIAAAVLGVPYRIDFGGTTLFQYAEDVAKTLLLASRAAPAGARVYNLGGSPVPIDDWIEAIEAVAPGARELISHDPSPLPFPSDIEHEGIRALGAVPVTPYREAIAATAGIYQRLKDEGRLNAAEQGVAAPAPAGTSTTGPAPAASTSAAVGTSSSARSSA